MLATLRPWDSAPCRVLRDQPRESMPRRSAAVTSMTGRPRAALCSTGSDQIRSLCCFDPPRSSRLSLVRVANGMPSKEASAEDVDETDATGCVRGEPDQSLGGFPTTCQRRDIMAGGVGVNWLGSRALLAYHSTEGHPESACLTQRPGDCESHRQSGLLPEPSVARLILGSAFPSVRRSAAVYAVHPSLQVQSRTSGMSSCIGAPSPDPRPRMRIA